MLIINLSFKMAELSSWQSYRVIKKFNNYFKFCGFIISHRETRRENVT